MDESADPERATSARELGRLLERAIDALPEGLRAVLVLRDVIELDTAGTAACLGIEPEHVRVRLHRARHLLAVRLAEARSEAVGAATAEVWRFDGERCARVLAHVMADLDDRGA